MRKMPQTRFAQTVCHFSHNADFDQLRISKYPANAHEINYFSMLVVGSFKYTLSESGKSPAGKPKGKNDEYKNRGKHIYKENRADGLCCLLSFQ